MLDQCLARVTERVLAHGGVVLMTADHGNCETMECPITGDLTAHTSNKVPFILIAEQYRKVGLRTMAPCVISLLPCWKSSI